MNETAIVTLVRGEPLLVDQIEIMGPEKASLFIRTLIARAQIVKKVSDVDTQNDASRVAGELKSAIAGLTANYKAAKQPILSAGRALDRLYQDLNGPMQAEYERLTELTAAYQQKLDRVREMAEAKARALQSSKKEAQKQKILELEREREALRLKLKFAEELKEKAEASKSLAANQNDIEIEKIALQLEQEKLPAPVNVPEPPKIPGGRKWWQYVCSLVNAKELIAYLEDPEQLLRIELKQAAAQEMAKALDEAGKPLQIPGLSIRKVMRTSFQGASSIRISGDEQVAS